MQNVETRERHFWPKQVPKRICPMRARICTPPATQTGLKRPIYYFQTVFDGSFYASRGTSEFCSSPNCDVTKQQQCVQIVKRYQSTPNEPEEAVVRNEPDEEYQILRHVVLLLILSCSMFVVRNNI